MTSATAQAAPGQSDEAATQRQPARNRQLRAAKQARTPLAAQAAPVVKVQRARSMQLRQLATSKSLATRLPAGTQAARPPKVAKARVAQVGQKATRAVAQPQ